MARPLTPSDDVMDKVVPPLAAAILGGGSADPEIRELLKEVLGGIAEKRTKEKQMRERLAQQAVQTAQEMEQQRAARQNGCSHLKQDGRSTRLAGQVTSGIAGKRQLVLVCQWCHKEFHTPPNAGQEAPPQHLMPPGDEIGG